MELKEFIKITITEIMDGIKEAQKEQESYSAKINPSYATSHYQEINGQYFAIRDIDFEIALSESQSGDNKKGISVSFPMFSGNIGDGKSKSETAGTKVSFSVPVIFPVPEK